MTPTRPYDPRDADPLTVEPAPVRRDRVTETDDPRLWGILVGASVIIGILIAIAMLAASRSALGPPLPGGRELVRAQTGALHTVSGPVTSHPADARQSVPRGGAPVGELPGGSARPGSDTSTVIGEPLYVVRDSRKPSGEVQDGFPLPDTGTLVSGTATWYCGGGSACTRGYGPSDLVAAIDRKDSPFRRGDRVVVRSGGKRVTVTIVDVCACRGRRVIDLTSGAFSRLAPLSRGVIGVTLEAADRGPSPTLPATDTAP